MLRLQAAVVFFLRKHSEGYRDYDDTGIEGFDYRNAYGEKGFSFSLISNNLTFSMIYDF